MGLAGVNGAFSGVPTVDIRRNQLEFHSPIGRDGLFVGFAGLIVQNLQVHDQLAILEALYDGVVCY